MTDNVDLKVRFEPWIGSKKPREVSWKVFTLGLDPGAELKKTKL